MADIECVLKMEIAVMDFVAGGGCRSIAGAGPDTYLCSPPPNNPKIEPLPIE